MPQFAIASPGHHDVVGSGGLSSSSHALASAAGAQMLLRGGNAVDAALATAFALVVCEPAMSHLGGQGNMLIQLAGDADAVGIDGYPTAPGAAHAEMYEWIESPTQGGYRFWTKGGLNDTGALSVAVPGNLAAWFYAYRRWTTLPLRTLVAPAIGYARDGVPMTLRMARFTEEARERLARFPASAALFLRPDGSPLQEGDVVVQKDLARTLQLLVEGGEDAFYRGEIGQALVEYVQAEGGILTRDDLERYPREQFRVLEPQRAPFRGFEVLVSPPSSSATLLPILRLLEGFDLAQHEPLSTAKLHLLAQCMKPAFADRVPYTGDHAFVDMPLEGLLSAEYAAARRAEIDERRATFPGPGNPWAYQGERLRAEADSHQRGHADNPAACTTHHVHADRWGGLVSWTQTQGDAFGSAMVVPGYGFLLNNAMKLFDPRPGGSNSIAPGKRPGTAPCPTLVRKDGRPVMALGSPSGTRIINAIAQTLVNTIDHGLCLQAAVDLPRIHWSGDEFEVEADIPADALEGLRAMGHTLEVRHAKSPWFGAVQAVAWEPDLGVAHGAADPRRQGAVVGVAFDPSLRARGLEAASPNGTAARA
ncbi:MAG: gamma-glutamyltransferase [Chloroflexi bacterium]|nr:gamma-glutamyltransferase [Chloroflexota bacterium]